MNIAILASGNGTNLEALAKAAKKGYFKADIKLLITDKKEAFARIRAKKLGLKDIFINPKDFSSRLEFDKEIVKILKKEKTDLVTLAGYMRIISPYFVKIFKNKIINIHPALLPAFKGVRSIERALKHGSKITGVTVHFVDEKIDHGPIILQESLKIKKNETLKELEKRVHKLEHKLYPLAIKLIIEKDTMGGKFAG
ncbi:MAG: phosphoribosylglycinamide formyltransferase [Candidatus Omnitrophota bacterium]